MAQETPTAIGVRTAYTKISAEDLLKSFQPGQSHVLLTLRDQKELTQKNAPHPTIRLEMDESGKVSVEVDRGVNGLPPGSEILISREKLESMISSHSRICNDLGLVPPPALNITREDLDRVSAFARGKNEVSFGTAALLVSTPTEIDAVLAHELGHIYAQRNGIQATPREHEKIADNSVVLNACEPNALGSFFDKARGIGDSLKRHHFIVGNYSLGIKDGTVPPETVDNLKTPHPPAESRKADIARETPNFPRPGACRTR